MADIAVESFDVDVGASLTTYTLTNDVSDISNAFVRRNCSSDKSSSGPTGSTSNTAPNVAHIGCALTDTDEITWYRNTSTTCKVIGEVWRYTGSPGGANEFISRGTYAVSISGTTGSSAVSGISDRNKCVPFLLGVNTSENSVSDYEQCTFYTYIDASGNVVVGRNNSGTSATVYVQVVEFTGSNWSVGHGVATNQESATTVSVILDTDSTGGGGDAFDVGDWDTAFIEGSMGGDSAETGLADVMMMLYPGAGTGTVTVSLREGDGNARNDSSVYIHVVQNDDMIVSRANNNNIAEGNGSYGTATWPAGASTDRNLDELALEWYVTTSGTGTAHKRASLGARITAASGTIQHWVHRSGNTVRVRYGVIDLSQLNDVSVTGQMKVYDGADWVAKPVKVWTGADWETKPLKRWSGTDWEETTY
jgi:hypothetical protein